jgi:dipeptidyl aminopeptidase/acylaminoacyl peptidase
VDSAGLVYSALGCNGCPTYELRGNVPKGVPVGGHQLAPVFASAGRSLFVEIARDGRSRVLQVRDGVATWWTPDDWTCVQPASSADATRVAAVCDGHLYLFDAPAHGRVLSLPPGELADPALSTDGTRLAFARLEDKESHWRLYELAPAAGGPHPLTSGRGDERGPRYSPDGTALVFSRRVDGRDAVWLRDLASGAEHQLTRSAGNDNQPAWSSDGRSVYFASDRGRGIFMPAVFRLDLR